MKPTTSTLTAMQLLGLNVAVLRGREAADPETGNLETGDPILTMCHNLPAVEDSLAVGYDPEQTACGSAKPGKPACPYRSECAYQRQKSVVAQADVIIASQQALFYSLPKQARQALAVVVVDEAWWQSGTRPNQTTALASFGEELTAFPVLSVITRQKGRYFYETDQAATDELIALSQKGQSALATVEDESFLDREALNKAGLTADDCSHAITLEWRRKREGLIWPGQRPVERRKALDVAAGNAGIPRRVAVWDAMRTLLESAEMHTGRVQIATRTDREARTFRAILLHGRSDIRSQISALPMLLLDATMPVGVVRYYLPRINVLAHIRAAAPHMTVRQVVGGWGKTSIVPSPHASEAENNRRTGVIGDLTDFVQAKGGGDALVVTYQAIEPHFEHIQGVRTGHFNAIAGLDSFNTVRSVFVIGRPLPDPRELRLQAIALTGRPIPEQEAQRETRGALMADGTGAAISVRAYADPDLEAVRTAISDAEVVQAIGRGRAINRTAETPLDVWVMADVCLPLPVNALVRWVDVRLNPVQRMAARGAVFQSPADAAKACLDLFPTADAARMAINRALGAEPYLPNIPLGYILPRGMFGKSPRTVTYRPTGRGQQTRRAIVLDWRLDGFREWLETLLGPLTLYEVADPPPPTPPAPEPTPPSVGPDDGDPRWAAEPWHQADPQEHNQDWWRQRMADLARTADDGRCNL